MLGQKSRYLMSAFENENPFHFFATGSVSVVRNAPQSISSSTIFENTLISRTDRKDMAVNGLNEYKVEATETSMAILHTRIS